MTEGYFVEHNGDCWQSVFPSTEAHKSQLHTSVGDALAYMVDECGVSKQIAVVPRDLGDSFSVK